MINQCEHVNAGICFEGSLPIWYVKCKDCGLRGESSYSDSLNSRENLWRKWKEFISNKENFI